MKNNLKSVTSLGEDCTDWFTLGRRASPAAASAAASTIVTRALTTSSSFEIKFCELSHEKYKQNHF